MNRIFVYGTLRKGYGNNRLLAEANFIGPAKTVEDMAMYGGGIPFVNDRAKLYPIIGELYEVDDNTLTRLDALEGHPNWYYRHPIQVELLNTGEVVDTEIYFNDNTSNMRDHGDYSKDFKIVNLDHFTQHSS